MTGSLLTHDDYYSAWVETENYRRWHQERIKTVSRKHNTRHDRSKSRYPDRLRARGLGSSPRMPSLGKLRAKQLREAAGLEPLEEAS